VFAGLEGGDDLTGMEVVTGGNDDCINVRIVDNCTFVSGREFETELMSHMLGTNAGSCANANKFDAFHPLHCREESSLGKFTGAEQADPYGRKA
jgi:hypothetical protein